MNTAYEKLLKTEEGRLAVAEEHAIAHVAELICNLLEKNGMTRTELSKKMGVSQGRVTQLLDGDANMKLSTIARALLAFDRVLECSSRPIDEFCAATIFRLHSATSSGWQSFPKNYRTDESFAPTTGANDSKFSLAV